MLLPAGFGYVKCEKDDECPDWEGFACFYDGASLNFKICGARSTCPVVSLPTRRHMFSRRTLA